MKLFQSKNFLVGLCIFLSVLFPTFGEDAIPNAPKYGTKFHQRRQVNSEYTGCSVCGKGKKVGAPDVIFTYPGQPSVPCGLLETAGEQGLIPYDQCKLLPPLVDPICFCNGFVDHEFIDNAVLINNPPQEGVQVTDTYLATYNVTYLKAGIVALAQANVLIDHVMCGSGSNGAFVEITFNTQIIDSSNLPLMFPPSSILAVDGALFGKCDVWPTGDDNLFASGFLIIKESVLERTNVVRVTGDPAFFNYLFKERDIVYETFDNSNLRHQQRALLEITETFSGKKTFLEGEPIEIEIGVEVTPIVNLHLTRDYWRLLGSGWWNYDPYIDFQLKTDVEIKAKASVKASMKISGKKEFDKEIDWLKFPIPNAGFQLPDVVISFINKVLPDDIQLKAAVGVSVEVPAYFKIELKSEIEYFISASVESTTGKASLDFGISGNPTRDLSFPLQFTNEPASGSTSMDTNLNDGPDGEIELTMFAGFKPQLKLNAIGFAEASIGITSGMEGKAALFTPPKDPIEADPSLPKELGICDKCHSIEANLAAVAARNLFFEYKVIGGEEDSRDLLEFDLKQDLIKVCLIEGTCDAPNPYPTKEPSPGPSESPSEADYPTKEPSPNPSESPSAKDVGSIPISVPPTTSPWPSPSPSASPTDKLPSDTPTESPKPSPSPSVPPTISKSPTPQPTFGIPTASPAPTGPSASPSDSPAPTPSPSDNPTDPPPSVSPTQSPKPSPSPTGIIPTASPSVSPAPSSHPTQSPEPSPAPSASPTITASANPTASQAPSATPTSSPVPTPAPSNNPTISYAPTTSSDPPTDFPTFSNAPSSSDSPSVTFYPSEVPSLSQVPSETLFPSTSPSLSQVPSVTSFPSSAPSD